MEILVTSSIIHYLNILYPHMGPPTTPGPQVPHHLNPALPPVLKVVYNSLIHPYHNYSILNWGRASNATIQPLIKLQNKAIKK